MTHYELAKDIYFEILNNSKGMISELLAKELSKVTCNRIIDALRDESGNESYHFNETPIFLFYKKVKYSIDVI